MSGSSSSVPNYGPEANAAGGMFDPSEVGPLGPSPGGDYDPDAVQQMINDFIKDHAGKGMTEFQTEYLMWLMQEYGNQTIGVGANTQTQMNKYFKDVQNLWSTLNKAENPPKGSTEDFYGEFHQQIFDLQKELNNDPYFKAHPDMLSQILGTLQSIDSAATAGKPPQGVDPLVYMWQQYNGTVPGTTGQGNPQYMDNLMRNLGQANQEFTGVSQSVGTVLQSDAKNQQSEMDALNNFLKMLQKLVQAFVQSQRVN